MAKKASSKKKTTSKTAKARRIAKRLLAIEYELEALKPLYEERDELTLQLRDELESKGLDSVTVEQGDEKKSVKVVNNFAEKNTVFRAAGVKQYEAKIQSVEDE